MTYPPFRLLPTTRRRGDLASRIAAERYRGSMTFRKVAYLLIATRGQ
jgi:hypothetical protein